MIKFVNECPNFTFYKEKVLAYSRFFYWHGEISRSLVNSSSAHMCGGNVSLTNTARHN